MDFLRLGSAARKTATPAGREHGECLCLCSAPLPFPLLQGIENVLRQIIPASQPSWSAAPKLTAVPGRWF